MIERDYTIHLRVMGPDGLSPDEVDEIVQHVMKSSSVRQTIQVGIDYALAVVPGWESTNIVNLYVVRDDA